MNGFAVINKPSGISSSDVVIKCRNALSGTIGEKIKCGHMGTLDPMASGVLIVAFGNATRLFDYLLEKTKTYRAVFVFGEERDTLDAEGVVTSSAALPEYKKLAKVIPQFIGTTSQIPPKYSAVKINGRKAYDLARAGKDFDIKAKEIYIKDIKILDKTLIDNKCESIELLVECGGGTYIRSLCRDIAYKADTLGYMASLVRTECGGYNIDEAINIQDFVDSPVQFVRPCKQLLAKIMPIVDIDGNQYKKIRNGQTVEVKLADGLYGAKLQDKLCFILKVQDNTAKSVCYLED